MPIDDELYLLKQGHEYQACAQSYLMHNGHGRCEWQGSMRLIKGISLIDVLTTLTYMVMVASASTIERRFP